jgi:hypothetical protein
VFVPPDEVPPELVPPDEVPPLDVPPDDVPPFENMPLSSTATPVAHPRDAAAAHAVHRTKTKNLTRPPNRNSPPAQCSSISAGSRWTPVSCRRR